MKESSTNLDRTDRRILTALQRNARIANQELADQVGISASACWRRVRLLESAGVIQRYAAVLDPVRLGLPVSILINVSLEKQGEKALQVFESAVAEWPEVMECYLMTGDADYLLRVVVADLAAYEQFLMRKLTRIPGIASIRSSFALRAVRRRTELPIGG
jgi:DNA-binding Lrp family transcriptional regulator